MKTAPNGWTSCRRVRAFEPSPGRFDPCGNGPHRVLVTVRPKYACRACTDGVTQAPAPATLIEGGLPTEGAVAHVLVSRYADHLPLYRQSQMLARSGVTIDRGTLANWGEDRSRRDQTVQWTV